MCRIASLTLLQRLKGSMSGDAGDFNNTLQSFLVGLRTYQHPLVYCWEKIKFSYPIFAFICLFELNST